MTVDPARSLARLLGGMGALHFLAPKPFDAIVPDKLPGKARTYTYASGAAELAVAAALAFPRTRRIGGLAAAGLITAVFPANVQMAYDWRHRARPLKALAYGRLPLQVPLVAWALLAARQGAKEQAAKAHSTPTAATSHDRAARQAR
ncbi:DoxX family protein [Streptomyces lasiicapitis]|uniref:DoxX family protein n=1 Tax=Streptomyces lasiicapitis TaxID=1923961 RepID=UPI00364C509C